MIETLRNRNFALLWLAQLISMTGDWVIFIALPIYMYQQTGSALATGAMFISNTLPRLLVGSVAGVFVDRWDRKRTMIVADFIRAALVIVLLGVIAAEQLWLIFPLAFLESAVSQFFNQAKNAVLPQLVRKRQLVTANSLSATSENLTRLIGPPLGGALIGILGVSSVLLLDAVTYAMSAALIMLIAVSRRRDSAPDEQGARGSIGIWTEWRSGLRVVAHNRRHSAVFISVGTATFGLGILNALMIVFVAEVLGGGALQLSSLLAAQAGGGLAAGLLLSQAGRGLQPSRMIPLGAVGMALLVVAIVNSPNLAFAIPLTAILGAPVVAFFVSAQTLLHRGVSDAYRGRVFGAFSTTQALTMVVGMGLATLLGDWMGVLPLMHVAAVAFLAAGMFAALRLVPGSSEEGLDTERPVGFR